MPKKRHALEKLQSTFYSTILSRKAGHLAQYLSRVSLAMIVRHALDLFWCGCRDFVKPVFLEIFQEHGRMSRRAANKLFTDLVAEGVLDNRYNLAANPSGGLRLESQSPLVAALERQLDRLTMKACDRDALLFAFSGLESGRTEYADESAIVTQARDALRNSMPELPLRTVNRMIDVLEADLLHETGPPDEAVEDALTAMKLPPDAVVRMMVAYRREGHAADASPADEPPQPAQQEQDVA